MIKKSLSCLLLTLLVLGSLFFYTKKEAIPSSKFAVSQTDRPWLTQFFKDVMLFETGIYTLFGSKPMTTIILPKYTQEEIENIYQQMSEEDKQSLYHVEDYDLPNLWKKWELVQDKFPISNKYILKKSELYSNDKIDFIYFVDIVKTALIIEDNYTYFKKIVGFDFHPLEAVLELKDEAHSPFWLALHKENSSFISGILFGFGKTNALLFEWKHFTKKDCSYYDFCQTIPTYDFSPPPKKVVRYSIDAFNLPAFISFEEKDKVVEKYRKERDEIKKRFKNKDFLDVVIDALCE
ncbi:MAG: hypothetical protein BGO10_07665 [Chlamydia sp. 32-24]|nr:MAG: hypothetical protein BGO10_07665 [Chlamydia sp. 32-24]